MVLWNGKLCSCFSTKTLELSRVLKSHIISQSLHQDEVENETFKFILT